MLIEQISVFVENRPGKLAEVIEIIGGAGINLHALSLADTTDFGILRIIVSDVEKTRLVLRENGYVCSVTPVIAAAIADTPGSLTAVLRALAADGIGVEYLYAFITRETGGAYVILRVEDNARAADVLLKSGVKLIGAEDINAQ